MQSRMALLIARRLVIILTIGVASSLCATAQSAISINSDGMNLAAAGKPFEARGTAQSIQKLPNGSTIVLELHISLARDPNGRIWYKAVHPVEGSVPYSISYCLIDPVENRVLDWRPQSQAITRHRLAPNSHVTISPLPLAQDASLQLPANKKRVKMEDLSKRTIAGVEAHGKRTVTTIAARVVGNARPIVIIHEEWTSSELQLVLAESDENPLSGRRKSEITSLTPTSAAPPGIFQPLSWLPIQDAPSSSNELSNGSTFVIIEGELQH